MNFLRDLKEYDKDNIPVSVIFIIIFLSIRLLKPLDIVQTYEIFDLFTGPCDAKNP